MAGGEDTMTSTSTVVVNAADPTHGPNARYRVDIDGHSRMVRSRAFERGAIYRIDSFVSKLDDPALRDPADWVRAMDGVYVHKTKSAAVRAAYDTWIGRNKGNRGGQDESRTARARVYPSLIAPIVAARGYSYMGQPVPLARLACAVWHGPCPDGHRLLRDGDTIAPETVCWAPIFEPPAPAPQPEFAVNGAQKGENGTQKGDEEFGGEVVRHGAVVKGLGADLLASRPAIHPKPAFRQYPFETMEVNDAFEVPEKKANLVSASAAWYVKRYATEKHFVIRKNAKDGKTYIVRAK